MSLSPGGKIQGISLPAFLQMVQMEKSTCTLTVKGKKSQGEIHIREGEVIDASYRDLPALDAAYEILCLKDPVIHMQRDCAATERKIRVPMMHLLMEGARLQDEKLQNIGAEEDDEDEIPVLEDKETPEPTAPFQQDSGSGFDDEEDDELAALSAYEFSDDEIRQASNADFTQSVSPEASLQPIRIQAVQTSAKQPLKPEQPSHAEKPEPPKLSPAPKFSRKQLLIFSFTAIGFIVVAAAVSYFGYARYQHNTAYSELQESLLRMELPEQQEVLFTRFLDAFPESPHAEELIHARSQLRENILERDFRELMTEKEQLSSGHEDFERGLRLYDRFLIRHPFGTRTDTVKKLREDHILTMAKNMAAMTVQELPEKDWLQRTRDFQQRFPENPGMEILEKSIKERGDRRLAFMLGLPVNNRETRSRAVAAAREYMEDFPEHGGVERARTHLASLLRQQRIEDLQDSAEKLNSNEEMLRFFERTRREENDPQILAFVRQRITELEQKTAEDRMWESLQSDLNRPGLSETARISLLDRYLTESPPDHYRSRAQTMRNQILSERARREQQALEERRRQAALALQRQQAEERARATEARARLENATREMNQRLAGVAQRFINLNNGTVQDRQTGKIWMLTDSEAHTGQCLNFNEARDFVQNLDLGGHRDWRLPRESELAQIFKNPPAYPLPDPNRWYWSSELFSRGYTNEVRVVTARDESVFQRQSHRPETCGHAFAVRP
ncbi:uncharacterized protein DUF1566 [Desulfobotulus alkaliphilus]|uniref:Uncharacterized protein DUF1566 n=1 Tax=Desulfobotulus alkaliphilus TaxID=622671 RepID=A0A562S7F6_9BACT|nr:DUF4388 domain-containing protein [Desulfobotulus alkaliphilus]TWI77361.1 uncharacterized protein DUF1566 [Desulfobotulus alkaliphilus]